MEPIIIKESIEANQRADIIKILFDPAKKLKDVKHLIYLISTENIMIIELP
jgi:hypothetical protein